MLALWTSTPITSLWLGASAPVAEISDGAGANPAAKLEVSQGFMRDPASFLWPEAFSVHTGVGDPEWILVGVAPGRVVRFGKLS